MIEWMFEDVRRIGLLVLICGSTLSVLFIWMKIITLHTEKEESK